MLNATVREGGENDIAALHNLIQEDALAANASDYVGVTMDSRKADFAAGAFKFVLAEVDSQPIASAVYYELWDANAKIFFVYLDNLSVSETYRRRGVGRQLMKALDEIACKIGDDHVKFEVLKDNEPALAFFSKLGLDVKYNGLLNVSLDGDTLERLRESAIPNPYQISVRDATDADSEDVAGLIKTLAIVEGEGSGEDQGYIDGDLPLGTEGSRGNLNASVHFLLAEIPETEGVSSGKSRVVGLAIFLPCYSSWSGRGLKLHELCVVENARRLGVGHHLLQELSRRAAQMHIHRLEWMVYDWNEPARRLYESKLGAKINEDWHKGKLALGGLHSG
eukprot:gnl/MRDRNA2_/MRDRNA2_85186_c0_seq5.p1 gnl/MRDRNA2_/MRDRNA2_85186_c0~~gnl/MRDRNA2_/MRDRNA2_85186_c0_seq5.p1  ORF type:complete len:336 (+),score=62.92 gnl/MRDRNA2_/MRDRNA2_85186_c0_seq5:69-1076(+)